MSTPWPDVLWDVPRPDEAAVAKSLARLRFTAEDITSPAVLQLLQSFNAMLTNGGALGTAFRVHDLDEVGQWFLSRNRFDEYGFVTLPSARVTRTCDRMGGKTSLTVPPRPTRPRSR